MTYSLVREGITHNQKKPLHIYLEERLRLRRLEGRKRTLDARGPTVLPRGPSQRWSLAFVSNNLIGSRRFRSLCVVDECTRECVALVTDTWPYGTVGARALTTLIEVRGKPHMEVRQILTN